MLLAVDAGNTSIKFALFSDTPEPVCCCKLKTDPGRTADEYAALLQQGMALYHADLNQTTKAICSSVVPQLTHAIRTAVRLCCPALEEFLMVGPGIKTGFSIQTDNPAELGTDLVANAACAKKEYSLPLIIADFGTATTLTFLDADARLQGAVILPGVKTQLLSLQSAAALLPDVSPVPEIERADRLPLFGKDSPSSIRCGVLRGQAFAIDGFVDACRTEWNGKITCIATGGLSEQVLPLCKNRFRVDPHLTIRGLYYLACAQNKKKQ